MSHFNKYIARTSCVSFCVGERLPHSPKSAWDLNVRTHIINNHIPMGSWGCVCLCGKGEIKIKEERREDLLGHRELGREASRATMGRGGVVHGARCHASWSSCLGKRHQV